MSEACHKSALEETMLMMASMRALTDGRASKMGSCFQTESGVRSHLYIRLQYGAALACLCCCRGPARTALINYDYAGSLPLVLRPFWPWTDHPQAQWVGDGEHVLDSSQQTRASHHPREKAPSL